MLKDVVEVRVLGGHRLYLGFEDGVAGEPHVGDLIDFRGVFGSLRDEAEFAKVRLNQELGTVVRPSGADLVPTCSTRRLRGVLAHSWRCTRVAWSLHARTTLVERNPNCQTHVGHVPRGCA